MKKTQDLARFVGAFLGDGWVQRNPVNYYNGRRHVNYGVGLAIGLIDQPHTAKYLSLLQGLFPQARWKNNAYGIVGITCSCKIVHQAIVGLGIAGYCDEKRVPSEWFSEPADVRMALLAGFMDADGHVLADTKNLSRGHIGSGNLGLLQDIRDLAVGVGLTVTQIRSYTRATNFPSKTQLFHQCWISGLTCWRVPMWHETKASRSRMLIDAQSSRKQPRFHRVDSGTWKSTPHIIKRKRSENT